MLQENLVQFYISQKPSRLLLSETLLAHASALGKNTAMINVLLGEVTQIPRCSRTSVNCCFQSGEEFQDPTRAHSITDC